MDWVEPYSIKINDIVNILFDTKNNIYQYITTIFFILLFFFINIMNLLILEVRHPRLTYSPIFIQFFILLMDYLFLQKLFLLISF